MGLLLAWLLVWAAVVVADRIYDFLDSKEDPLGPGANVVSFTAKCSGMAKRTVPSVLQLHSLPIS